MLRAAKVYKHKHKYLEVNDSVDSSQNNSN